MRSDHMNACARAGTIPFNACALCECAMRALVSRHDPCDDQLSDEQADASAAGRRFMRTRTCVHHRLTDARTRSLSHTRALSHTTTHAGARLRSCTHAHAHAQAHADATHMPTHASSMHARTRLQSLCALWWDTSYVLRPRCQ
mmetsp:Transcript_15489/g.33000  ORF Transcript_15489/g.33000 Transcript_15489/m.33000 type:complete len:143 (+) Transcript_15489:1038-1466(+)